MSLSDIIRTGFILVDIVAEDVRIGDKLIDGRQVVHVTGSNHYIDKVRIRLSEGRDLHILPGRYVSIRRYVFVDNLSTLV